MTCEQAMTIMSKPMSQSTNAECASAIAHTLKCKACDSWLNDDCNQPTPEETQRGIEGALRILGDIEAISVILD